MLFAGGICPVHLDLDEWKRGTTIWNWFEGLLSHVMFWTGHAVGLNPVQWNAYFYRGSKAG